MQTERRLPGPSFGFSAQAKQWLGAKKAPAGTDRRRAPAASRAQSGARNAPRRKTRAGGRGRGRTIRAQNRVPPPRGRPSRRRRGRIGAERNARERRYAGTEVQTYGDGMGNMTKHDTMRGTFHEPPCAAAAGGGGKDGPPEAAERAEAGPRRGAGVTNWGSPQRSPARPSPSPRPATVTPRAPYVTPAKAGAQPRVPSAFQA